MQKSNIEWCDYTWNPVTGCRRSCSYCYAQKIHERFYKTPFSDIVFHSKRIADKQPKKPSIIFVGSMSDVAYWDRNWIDIILGVCKANMQNTYMFLSKDPKAYCGYNWPSNTMQGLTIEKCESEETRRALWFHALNCPSPFLSIEPLLGIVAPDRRLKLEMFERVIVGAMTGKKVVAPKPEWIESVIDNIGAKNVFWKSNILKHLPQNTEAILKENANVLPK